MSLIWVLVAHQNEARLFQTEKNLREFKSLQRFENPLGKMREQDLDADRPGRSYSSVGTQRHALSPEVSSQEEVVKKFVREVSHFLEKECSQHRFDRLALFAPSSLLGEFRACFSKDFKQFIFFETDKDFPSYLSDHELTKALRQLLEEPVSFTI